MFCLASRKERGFNLSERGYQSSVPDGSSPKEYRAFEDVAGRKLRSLESAKILLDSKSHLGNRLEVLKGDRKGKYSIRFKDQWRICFLWKDKGRTKFRSSYH